MFGAKARKIKLLQASIAQLEKNYAWKLTQFEISQAEIRELRPRADTGDRLLKERDEWYLKISALSIERDLLSKRVEELEDQIKREIQARD